MYFHKRTAKWIFIFLAICIGILSLFYNHHVLHDLRKQELREIKLFAKGIRVAASLDSVENINFLIMDILSKNYSIPMILTDQNGTPQQYRNIHLPTNILKEDENRILREEIKKMKKEYDPIEIHPSPDWKQYVYYKHSPLFALQYYYLFIQLSGIAIFAMLAYLMFAATRRAEQNKMWVGFTKETAHQLGTPISSLMAWTENFKIDPTLNRNIIEEMNKDIRRLEMITARFSNMKLIPSTKLQPVDKVVMNIANYLQKRIPPKVKLKIVPKLGQNLAAYLNAPLFEWIIGKLM